MGRRPLAREAAPGRAVPAQPCTQRPRQGRPLGGRSAATQPAAAPTEPAAAPHPAHSALTLLRGQQLGAARHLGVRVELEQGAQVAQGVLLQRRARGAGLLLGGKVRMGGEERREWSWEVSKQQRFLLLSREMRVGHAQIASLSMLAANTLGSFRGTSLNPKTATSSPGG